MFVFLLICTLVSSVAWAWDSHGVAFSGSHDRGDQTMNPHDVPVDDDHGTFHDHFCGHGWAHLLGLQSDYTGSVAMHRDVSFLHRESALSSEITPPPSKPPRA